MHRAVAAAAVFGLGDDLAWIGLGAHKKSVVSEAANRLALGATGASSKPDSASFHRSRDRPSAHFAGRNERRSDRHHAHHPLRAVAPANVNTDHTAPPSTGGSGQVSPLPGTHSFDAHLPAAMHVVPNGHGVPMQSLSMRIGSRVARW